MSMKKVIFYMLFLLLAGTACNRMLSYEEQVTKQLEKYFSAEELAQYERIVFIPNGGCAGCVLQAEDYFLHTKEDTETLFVFTNFLSRKDLNIKLGESSINRPNVWLDNDNSLYFSQYKESLYPCVIYVSGGKIGRFANLDELDIEK